MNGTTLQKRSKHGTFRVMRFLNAQSGRDAAQTFLQEAHARFTTGRRNAQRMAGLSI